MFDLMSHPGALFAELDRFRREVDEVFGLTGQSSSIRSAGPGAFPALNIGSAPGSVEIYAFAPGIDPEKIEVTVNRGVLVIAGERHSALPERNDGKLSVYAHERFSGRFKRAVSLPEDVDPAKVEAKYRDGVLHITIGRRESSLPRRINVQ